MSAEDLAREIQAWQDEQWQIQCTDPPTRTNVDLAQRLTAAGWVKESRIDAGMVVLNHWREAMLNFSKKYREHHFQIAAHALAMVDGALHGSDDVGIPHNHPDWQKYIDARPDA